MICDDRCNYQGETVLQYYGWPDDDFVVNNHGSQRVIEEINIEFKFTSN